MPNNLANVRLSELPAALAVADDASVMAFYLALNASTMAAGTFNTDPFRAAVKVEQMRRDQRKFDAAPAWEKTPDAYRN